MIVAQSLGEYGALASQGAGPDFSTAIAALETQIRYADRSTWFMVLGAAFVLWFVFRKR